MIRKIFSASFEESLNLLDNEIIRFVEKERRQVKSKKKSKYFKFFVLTFLFITVYSVIASEDITNNSFHFFPEWLFWLGFILTVIIEWLVSIKKNNKMKMYMPFVRLLFYLILLTLFINLLLIQFSYSKDYFIISLATQVLSIIISIIVLIKGVKRIHSIIYGLNVKKINNETEFVVKAVKSIIYILPFIVIGKYILKWGFNIEYELGLLGALIYLVLSHILSSALCIYYIFPYLLLDYYRYKYHEEYQLLESEK